MAQDIDLYIDSKYAGFFPLEEIEERFEEYEAEAYELSRIIDWDEEAKVHADKLVERELSRLRISFEAARQAGYRRFICGMAIGCDMYFAEAVLALKQLHPDVILEEVKKSRERRYRSDASNLFS